MGPTANPLPPFTVLDTGRRLALPPEVLAGRDAIEGFFDRLNRNSPAAHRSLAGGGPASEQHLRAAALQLLPGHHNDATFIVETQTTLSLDLLTRDVSLAPQIYSIGLPLAGAMRVTTSHGIHEAQAGEGLVIDPAQTERIQVVPGTHFIEFDLPKRCMLSLGSELAPGAVGGPPRFVPLLPAGLAQRVLAMALQATASAQAPGRLPQGRQILAQRWNEMIALTLLNEQPTVDAAPPLALSRGPAPASLRRALEFINGHAERDLLLADIAAAACISGSSLLRQFNDHLGLTPGAVLRQVRLDRARAELRRGASGSVRELALRWGFQNPSKFSAAYLRRFGENPSDTRARRV